MSRKWLPLVEKLDQFMFRLRDAVNGGVDEVEKKAKCSCGGKDVVMSLPLFSFPFVFEKGEGSCTCGEVEEETVEDSAEEDLTELPEAKYWAKVAKGKSTKAWTQFPSGAVRDISQTEKGRYDLVPWEAVHALAMHCAEGAEKYGERNCEKGIPLHSLIDSALRHLSCYLQGKDDEPHLRAALWNIAFAIWTEQKRPDLQDIPMREGKEGGS